MGGVIGYGVGSFFSQILGNGLVGGFLNSVLTGAVTNTVTGLYNQTLMMQLGFQDSYDFKRARNDAITGAISGAFAWGFSYGFHNKNGTIRCDKKQWDYVLMHAIGGGIGAGIGDAGTQLYAMRYEDQKDFDFYQLGMSVTLGIVSSAAHAHADYENSLKACFAAGTPIVVNHAGQFVAIEQLRPGDWILSRSEHNPDGPLELKQVQEVFVRTGKIFALTVDGRVIKTTGEHPFWIVDLNEWIYASKLKPGNKLLTPDGRWATVEEVKDTGEFAIVYNVSVADYHTYFVGGQEWGWSVWAHNRYDGDAEAQQRQKGEMIEELTKRGVIPENAEWIAEYYRRTRIEPGTAKLEQLKRSPVSEQLNPELLPLQPHMTNRQPSSIEFNSRGEMYITTGYAQHGKQQAAIRARVAEMAESGEFLYIVMGRELADSTGLPGLNGYPKSRLAVEPSTGRLKPDIVGLRFDGGVLVTEVRSPGQVPTAKRAGAINAKARDFDLNVQRQFEALLDLVPQRNPIVVELPHTYRGAIGGTQ